MASKLETLTDAQWADVHASRDRVIAETVTPGPADRARVESGIEECYHHLGLPKPQCVWVDGPLSAVIAANLLGSVHLGGQLGGQLGDQLWGQLGGQRWCQLGGQLWDQLGGKLGDISYDAWWLQWAHHWLTVNELVAHPVASEQVSLTRSWIDAHSASTWMPYENVAIISDRHTRLTRDGEGRLHSSDGKAAWEWADGTAVYAHHGRRVDPWVVSGATGHEQVARIAAEQNIEVRRCAIERYGWAEYVSDAGWTPVASDRYGALYDVPGEDDQRVCVVTNGTVERDGTQRKYGLLCRAHHRTPLEAVAASYGVSAEQYGSLERRT